MSKRLHAGWLYVPLVMLVFVGGWVLSSDEEPELLVYIDGEGLPVSEGLAVIRLLAESGRAPPCGPPIGQGVCASAVSGRNTLRGFELVTGSRVFIGISTAATGFSYVVRKP